MICNLEKNNIPGRITIWFASRW